MSDDFIVLDNPAGVQIYRLRISPEVCRKIADNTLAAGYTVNWRGDGAQKASHHKAILQRHMQNGTWVPDDSIIVLTDLSADALAADGIHRLLAAADLGFPLDTWAIVKLQVGEHFDKGKARNLTQRAKRHGFSKFTTDIMGASKNVVGRQVARDLDLGLAIAKSAWVTEDMVIDFATEHHDLIVGLVSPKIPAKWGLAPSVINCALVELALTGYIDEARSLKMALKSSDYLETTDADDAMARFISKTSRTKAGTGNSLNSNAALAGLGKAIPKWFAQEKLASWINPQVTPQTVRDYFLKPLDTTALDAITA